MPSPVVRIIERRRRRAFSSASPGSGRLSSPVSAGAGFTGASFVTVSGGRVLTSVGFSSARIRCAMVSLSFLRRAIARACGRPWRPISAMRSMSLKAFERVSSAAAISTGSSASRRTSAAGAYSHSERAAAT